MPATTLPKKGASSKRIATTRRGVGRRVVAGRQHQEISITTFWQHCLEREIPNQPQGWHNVLKQVVKEKRRSRVPDWERISVHDAACGTGRVLEHLHQQGVPISGSDASLRMLLEQIHTDTKAIVNGANALRRPRVLQKLWTELPGYFAERNKRSLTEARPKIMIVPGSSIPYAGAWDRNPSTRNPAIREQSIKNALSAFRESIRPGGVLILTTTPDKSFQSIRKHGREVEEYRAVIQGQNVRIREVITHQPKFKIRKWETIITFPNGHTQRIERNAFMLPRSELRKMLKEAGFIKIRNIDVPGEKGHYDGVIAEVQ